MELQTQTVRKQKKSKNTPLKPRNNNEKSFLPLAAFLFFGAIISASWFLMPGDSVDDISQQEKDDIALQYQNNSPFKLPFVERQEAKKMIDSLPVNQNDKNLILSDYDNGQVELIEITLWDNWAEDGDVVKFSIGNFAMTVPILNAPVTFVMPLPTGVKTVQVEGIKDGGGGITAAIKTSKGDLSFPIMWPGQIIQLPLF